MSLATCSTKIGREEAEHVTSSETEDLATREVYDWQAAGECVRAQSWLLTANVDPLACRAVRRACRPPREDPLERAAQGGQQSLWKVPWACESKSRRDESSPSAGCAVQASRD